MLVFFVLLDYLFRSVEKENFFCGISPPPPFFFLVVFVPYSIFCSHNSTTHGALHRAHKHQLFGYIKKGRKGHLEKLG